MNKYNKIIEILNTHQKKKFYILIIYQAKIYFRSYEFRFTLSFDIFYV